LYSPPIADPPPANPANTITVANHAFSPASATFHVHEWVKVVNNDDVEHNITLTSPGEWTGFVTGTIEPGGSATLRLPSRAGTYTVTCVLHPDLTGTVRLDP
jgi:plastocyanin